MPKSTVRENKFIIVKGARVNNLKNIDLNIPRDRFIVITGLSGSGKSSLAFDTLYAEGQRRYVESLSSYARQFLGRITKPEVDFIKGIPPAIAVEQRVNTRNPRSTVGTSTEIYDYIKLLYARIGKTYSPVSGNLVKRHSVTDAINYIYHDSAYTLATILSTLKAIPGKKLRDRLEVLNKQGFTRVEIDGKIERIADLLNAGKLTGDPGRMLLVIDRVGIEDNEDTRGRLADSVQTAFHEGHGECIVRISCDTREAFGIFSDRFEADGIIFEEPSVHTFSFNNPLGACPVCEGFGQIIGIDEDLVIPDKSLSVFGDAIACWKGEKMCEWKERLVYTAPKFGFPIHKPIYELTPEQKQLLWTGNSHFKGLNDFFRFVEENCFKIQYRVMQARYRGRTTCPECQGSRLKKEVAYIKVGGMPITELVLMPVNKLYNFFDSLHLDEYEWQIAKRLLTEIRNRLSYLMNVGLGYLTINRLSSTLSGGESQRINLATSLGSNLVGSLYILDEPSIGLHPRDNERLIKVLRQLQEIGNTVVVVEHDEGIIRASDQIIDIGPLAGRLGGEVVFQGTLAEMLNEGKSLTSLYLSGKNKVTKPLFRRKWNNYVEVLGARENNLKSIDVKFPLNTLTVVTGVSGSGKSSLVKKILYPALKKQYGGFGEKTGKFGAIKGDFHLLTDVEFIDQNPIGKSSRSNPVTYIKAYDEIRSLFANQQMARHNGFNPSYFSFNVDGGRCEECEGDGIIKVEMQFMADVHLICDSCKGHRFKEDILEVKYRNKNIFDVLEMTVDEALEFFSENKETLEKRIVSKLKPLADVGLGYVKLGQSSSSLSGGESQRVKLASFLCKDKPAPTLFIFDEPTTGLHFHDINKLLDSITALIKRGHTVIIIEHNPEVIKCADWIIDLGPEGGEDGGEVVFAGTPEDLAVCGKGYTGKFLKDKLG